MLSFNSSRISYYLIGLLVQFASVHALSFIPTLQCPQSFPLMTMKVQPGTANERVHLEPRYVTNLDWRLWPWHNALVRLSSLVPHESHDIRPTKDPSTSFRVPFLHRLCAIESPLPLYQETSLRSSKSTPQQTRNPVTFRISIRHLRWEAAQLKRILTPNGPTTQAFAQILELHTSSPSFSPLLLSRILLNPSSIVKATAGLLQWERYGSAMGDSMLCIPHP